MLTPRVLRKEPFSIADINVEVQDHEWTATPEYERIVGAAWEKRISETKYPLWDGTYYRVMNIAEACIPASTPMFRLGTIRYRYIATFPALCQEHKKRRLEALYHLSTIALIQTTDDYYLFGKRTRNGAIDIIGGGVQKDELAVSTGADIERNLFKEIREEIGIPANAIERMNGIGILLSGTTNVLVVGHACLRLSKADAELRFAERGDNEMATPIFVPQDKLRAFLGDMPDYRNLIPDLL
jgi:8-oxo-dGTP pyrophosphatase MutT (NUDIX family)